MILKVDVGLKLSSYTSLKRFMSQMNPKNCRSPPLGTHCVHMESPIHSGNIVLGTVFRRFVKILNSHNFFYSVCSINPQFNFFHRLCSINPQVNFFYRLCSINPQFNFFYRLCSINPQVNFFYSLCT